MTKLRQLWLLTALGALAVLAGGYFLLVSPQASKAAALREETQTQLQVNRGIKAKIDQLNAQKKNRPELDRELEQFAVKVPSNPALPALIRSLSEASDNAGVELVSVSPAAPVFAKNGAGASAGTVAGPNGTVLVQIPVAIQVAGTYAQISQFFNELETLPRALTVSQFGVVPGVPNGVVPGAQTTADTDMLTATLSSTVVMTTKPPAAAAPAAPPAETTK
jgi:Tfp pilus assembly protein PilO